jgi:hypothetical protein
MSTPPANSEKKYDVAISFLIQDLALAQPLYKRLVAPKMPGSIFNYLRNVSA